MRYVQLPSAVIIFRDKSSPRISKSSATMMSATNHLSIAIRIPKNDNWETFCLLLLNITILVDANLRLQSTKCLFFFLQLLLISLGSIDFFLRKNRKLGNASTL